tara:strand:- start:356 stop:700 length:345 start_codon:yes stop_codon:yes gene_type:complete
VRYEKKEKQMKGPKRLYAGQYEWDVFDIYRFVSEFDGSVNWNIGVNKDYWFGEHGCFYGGYGIDTCNTYGECREIVQNIIEDHRYKVKYKGEHDYAGNFVAEKDENGNYIVEEK